MTFLAAAEAVVKPARGPLTTHEVTELALRRGLIGYRQDTGGDRERHPLHLSQGQPTGKNPARMQAWRYRPCRGRTGAGVAAGRSRLDAERGQHHHDRLPAAVRAGTDNLASPAA